MFHCFLLYQVRDESKTRVVTLLGGMRVVIVEAVTTMVVDGIVFRMERNYACCGIFYNSEASGIDCLEGLLCTAFTSILDYDDTVSTCVMRILGAAVVPILNMMPKKGSCNVDTGERANILIEFKCAGACVPTLRHHEHQFFFWT